MARRSLRSSTGGTPQSLKRAAPTAARPSPHTEKNTPNKQTPTRPAKKPKYEEPSDDEDDQSAGSSSDDDDDDAASGYSDNDASSASASSSDAEASEDDYSSANDTSRKRKRVTPKGRPSPHSSKGQELWRTGVKTGLGPGTQVVISRPKPRGPGKTPYKDERIHPNTLLFLEELAQNNDREWLKMHDPDYRTSWTDFTTFLEKLTEKITEVDETVPELPVKDIVFRIYRDVRFSKDPTPYKAWFSAAWSRTGRKGPYACYYIHIQPGANFLGGGLWQPEASALAKLRRSIHRHPDRIKAALTSAGIRKEYLKGVKKDEKVAVKAFVEKNKSSALKTKPKGFEADHPDIDLLRLRNFTIGATLTDDEVTGPGLLERTVELASALEPFITYLNNTVMPDDPEEESSDDDAVAEES